MKGYSIEVWYMYELADSVLEMRPPASPPKNLNWEILCREAARLSMIPFIYYGIENLNQADRPDVFTMEKIRKNKIAATLEEAAQQNLLRRVLSQFDAQDIPCLLYSDLFFRSLYPYPDMRRCEKIRIFLSEEMFPAADRILRHLGCTAAHVCGSHSISYRLGTTVLVLKTPIYRKTSGLSLKNIQKYKHYPGIYEWKPEVLCKRLVDRTMQATGSQKEAIWLYLDLTAVQRFYHFNLADENNPCPETLKSFAEKTGLFSKEPALTV